MTDLLAGVIVLAGGKSTRMGTPKAKLEIPSGETLLDYHLGQASQLAVATLIADNGQGFTTSLDTGVCSPVHIEDYDPSSSTTKDKLKHSAGPLGAILAGMQQLLADGAHNDSVAINSKWVMVVSCDSLIAAPDIWGLIRQSTKPLEAKAYCLSEGSSSQQRLYPLLGLYQLSLAQPLKTYLDSGERKVMSFIKPICQPVPMPKAWYDLSNLNTPEQFHHACQSLPV